MSYKPEPLLGISKCVQILFYAGLLHIIFIYLHRVIKFINLPKTHNTVRHTTQIFATLCVMNVDSSNDS